MYEKHVEEKKQGTLRQQPSVKSATNPTAIYDMVQLPSHTANDMVLQPNPAYGASGKVIMDDNPAYGSYKH